MSYGRAIKVIRVMRDMSQNDLAKRSGLHPSFLSMIERDQREASHDSQVALAAVLQVQPFFIHMMAAGAELSLEHQGVAGSHLWGIFTGKV